MAIRNQQHNIPWMFQTYFKELKQKVQNTRRFKSWTDILRQILCGPLRRAASFMGLLAYCGGLLDAGNITLNEVNT